MAVIQSEVKDLSSSSLFLTLCIQVRVHIVSTPSHTLVLKSSPQKYYLAKTSSPNFDNKTQMIPINLAIPTKSMEWCIAVIHSF